MAALIVHQRTQWFKCVLHKKAIHCEPKLFKNRHDEERFKKETIESNCWGICQSHLNSWDLLHIWQARPVLKTSNINPAQGADPSRSGLLVPCGGYLPPTCHCPHLEQLDPVARAAGWMDIADMRYIASITWYACYIFTFHSFSFAITITINHIK